MADRQHLTIFLIKEGISDPEEIVRGHPGPGIDMLDLSPEVDIDGELYLKRPSSNEPSWFRFVAEGLANPNVLDRLRNSSVSALLLLRTKERVFAIAFGYGRTMLEPEVLESRFGLIVVLNAVDPERLRSVDARTLEEVSLQTRRQLSRGAPIRSFELDLNRDLLRAVAGEPDKTGFANRLAGSIALAVETEIDFAGIPGKCRDALKLFHKKTYKRRFPWVDHVQLVTDPLEVARLDRALDAELAQANYDLLYLAAPEIIDYERIDHFRYSGDADRQFYELAWADYLATVKRGPPTVSRLRRETVGAYYNLTTDGLSTDVSLQSSETATLSAFSALASGLVSKPLSHARRCGRRKPMNSLRIRSRQRMKARPKARTTNGRVQPSGRKQLSWIRGRSAQLTVRIASSFATSSCKVASFTSSASRPLQR